MVFTNIRYALRCETKISMHWQYNQRWLHINKQSEITQSKWKKKTKLNNKYENNREWRLNVVSSI